MIVSGSRSCFFRSWMRCFLESRIRIKVNSVRICNPASDQCCGSALQLSFPDPISWKIPTLVLSSYKNYEYEPWEKCNLGPDFQIWLRTNEKDIFFCIRARLFLYQDPNKMKTVDPKSENNVDSDPSSHWYLYPWSNV